MSASPSTPTVSKRAKAVYSYKRVCIPKPGYNPSDAGASHQAKKFTTVSLEPSEWAKALKFAYGDARRVTDAIRHVAKEVNPEDVLPGDLSLIVRRKALARLRGQYRPSVAAEAEARAKAVAADAALAAANNEAWTTV